MKILQKKISNILIFILLSISLSIGIISESIAATPRVAIKTVDLTDIVTGTDVDHIHIYEKKYDSNNHWEECFICHSKINTRTHNLKRTNYSWGYESCYPGNTYTKYCSDGCGYKVTMKDECISDDTIKNVSIRYLHHRNCINCGVWMDTENCKDSNGQRITCQNLGTCVKCGHTYTEVIHHPTKNGNCEFCGKKFVELIDNKITYASDNSYVILMWRLRGINGGELTGQANWYSPTPAERKTSTITKNAENDYTYEYKIVFDKNVQSYNSANFDTNDGLKVNGKMVHFDGFSAIAYQDRQAPTPKSIQVEGNGTTTDFSRKATIIAKVTETFSDTVEMRLLAADKKTVLTSWGAATEDADVFTRVFDLSVEVNNTATVYVESRDKMGNVCTQSTQIRNMDTKAPTLISQDGNTTNWTTSKTITYNVNEEGSGGVQIAFNNQNDFQLANVSGHTYSRTYKFIGDIYGSVTGALYLKDAAGNMRTEKVTISNIDNTKPTITKITQNLSQDKKKTTITIEANDINTKLQKTGSGVAGYQITTSNHAPTSYQTSNTFTLTKNGTYYVWVKDAAGNVVQSSTEILVKNIENVLKINPNGGVWNGNSSEQTFKLTYQATKTVDNPTRNGFTFDGWRVSESTSSINGTTFTMGTADTILTANWRRNSYVLTVNPNGGVWNANSSEQRFELEYQGTKTIEAPTRTAYRFTGWTVEGTESSINETTFTMGYTNTTITAGWQLITHDINGKVTWNDENNKYTSRPENVTVTLNRTPTTGEITNLPTAKIIKGNAPYTFNQVQTYTADTGVAYNYTVAQNIVPGYETLYSGYTITNNLILPTYTSNINYEPIDNYQNQYLKNGKIKVIGQVQADTQNREKVGLHDARITFNIDDGIIIDHSTIEISYYEASTQTITKLTNYQIINHTIIIPYGKETDATSQKGDYLKIELQGTANKIGNYTSTIEAVGKLKDYRGFNTEIDLGKVSTTTKEIMVEHQLPEASIKLIKQDSITKESLTDAEFTLYEWNGTEYQEVEKIIDEDKDGIYISKVYRWNITTQGKYKIVETKLPIYHKDLGFQMEYTIDQLKTQNYIVTVDYDNTNYKIVYGVREPDHFSSNNGIVENEPWKIKAKINNIDKETQNTIQTNAKFTIYEWNNQTSQYEESSVKFERQENKEYLTNNWLYYTSKNQGKYRIIQTETPDGYYGDYNQNKEKRTYDINLVEWIEKQEGQNEATIQIKNAEKFENRRVKGTINLEIVDEQTKKNAQADAKLQDAIYGIYAFSPIYHSDGVTTCYEESGLLYQKDELIATQNTNSIGKTFWANMECGSYYIKMLQAPEGYCLDETKYKIEMEYTKDDTAHIYVGGTVEIPVKKQAFQLQKLQEDQKPLSGVGFSIYQISQLKIVKEGKIERKTANTYLLKDKNAKKDKELTQKANKDGTYNLADLITYYYKIRQEEENREEMPGDEQVYHPYNLKEEKMVKNYQQTKEGQDIEELKTDEKGYIQSPKLAYGEYIVIETSVPRNQDTAEPFIVEIQENLEEPQKLRVIIDPNFRSKIKLYVKDADTKQNILNNKSEYIIVNAKTNELQTYTVWTQEKGYIKCGTREEPFVVGEDGYLVIPIRLEVGEYIIEQVKAPLGYAKNWNEQKEQQNIRVNIRSNTVYYEDKQTGEYVTVVNQINEPTKIQIDTIDKETKETVTGVELEIKDEEGKTIAVSSKEAIQRGKYMIQKLPVGKYTIIETQIPYEKGYVIKQEKELKVEDTGKWQKTVIEQETSQINIKIQDEKTKEKLDNVQIYIRKKGTEEIIASTEEKGKKIEKTKEGYNIKAIPVGEYEIVEIVPDGYKQIEIQKLTIEDTSKVQTTTIENRKLIFSMEINKQVEEVRVNGKKLNMRNNQLPKIDVKNQDIKTQDIQIQYVIEVKNTGEIEGTIGIIKDIMPAGFEYLEKEPGIWKVNNIVATCEKYKDEQLQPGENKLIRITLKWKNSANNMGEKVNRAYLEGSKNKYNYPNEAKSTNGNTQTKESQISIIIGVQTGETNILTTIKISIILLTILAIVLIIIKNLKTHE